MMRHWMRLFAALACFTALLRVLPAHAQEVTPAPVDDLVLEVLDFIAAQPDDVAFLCVDYTQPENSIAFNADARFPLTAVFKIVILAEYARQADLGLLNPAEAVPLADLNAYWLPGTDGDAHQHFLDTLPAEASTVTLAQVADSMIAYNSDAAPDYLLARMGTDGFPALYAALGLQHTDLPVSYLGLTLALKNHETGTTGGLDAASFAAEANRLATLYRTDAAWRDAELSFQTADRDSAANMTLEQSAAIVAQQAQFYEQYGEQGSAGDMLTVLRAAFQPGIVPDGMRTVLQQHLSWLFSANPQNSTYYDALAWKNGVWPGLLGSVWYVSPKGGQPFALAAFYRHLPLQQWADWAFGSGAPQLLELLGIQSGGCAPYANLFGQ